MKNKLDITAVVNLGTGKMAAQLIELLTLVSGQMEFTMRQNGIPAKKAKEDVAIFMRGGTHALCYPMENAVAESAWMNNSLLAPVVARQVDSKLAAKPGLVSAMLRSNRLDTMSIVSTGVCMSSTIALLRNLSKRGIIYKDGKMWKPTDRFADKNLFGYDRFKLTPKQITSGRTDTLKVTFNGHCFIRVLHKHPELEPMDAYLKTFAE